MVTTFPEKVSWLFSYETADLKLMVLYQNMCHSSPTAALGYLWDNSDAHGCGDPQKSCCVTFSLLFLFSIWGWVVCYHFQSNFYLPWVANLHNSLTTSLQKNVSYVSTSMTLIKRGYPFKRLSTRHIIPRPTVFQVFGSFHKHPFVAEICLQTVSET